MSDLKEIFPARLKQYMRLSDMRPEKLAALAGCSVDSIKKYLCGSVMPQFKTAFAIAKALGCTPNDLCGITPDSQANPTDPMGA